MEYFLVYLVLRLDDFSFIAVSTSLLAACTFIVLVIIYLSNNIDRDADRNLLEKVKPWIKPAFAVLCVALFLSVVIPSTKQAAVVYCLPKIINNEQVQKMPDNLLRLANSWIDEAVNEAEEAIPENPLIDANATTD